MADDLNSRIREHLLKAGFESEFRALEVFKRRQWDCFGEFGYFDRDEEKSRDCDLHADFPRSALNADGALFKASLRIVAEVKKSANHPWVVMKEDLAPAALIDAWQNLTICRAMPADLASLAEPLSRYSLIERLKWRGRSIHEALGKPNQLSMAWGAVMSACKAAAAVLERETHSRAEEKGAQFMLIKPMVVVDGGLYSAELREGELLIEEVTAAPLRFHYQSGAYRERTEYAVDVVTLHGLDAYLKDAERRIAHFLETLQSVSVEAEAGSDE